MGVLGGTFDPIHEGHLYLAEQAMRFFSLDGVVLAPAGNPPHKDGIQAGAKQRLKMWRIACEGCEGLFVTDADIRDGKPSYSMALMKRLSREYADTRFYFILGADKLPNLHRWHKAEALFKLTDFIVCPREGERLLPNPEAERMGARIHVMKTDTFPGASHEIREQLGRYEDPESLPVKVLDYIASHSLYGQDVLPRLRTMMNEHRYVHTLGVRDKAVELARRFGAPVMKAALAALLHDCAKGMSTRELRSIALEHHLTEDDGILASGALLHGIVGAHLARTEFGITDEDVLGAIRCHTMGRENMSVLELVIFVADAIEQNRAPYPGLDKIREAAEYSLRCAALLSLYGTRDYVLSQGKEFVGQSYETMRDLEARLTKEETLRLHA